MSISKTHIYCWKVSAPEALLWEHWDDESVLFDRRSGQTHLLTLLARECLLILQEGCLDLNELLEKLEEQYEYTPGQQEREQIHQLLHNLTNLGLITTVYR